MSQILDIINDHTRRNLWYISHVEPDPAVMLELHPTVSLVRVTWTQECTCGTAKPWPTISEGRRSYLRAKNHSSPPHPSSLQTWTECAQIDASAQLLIIMLWLFHPAVEKICLDFTARADGSLIVKQHCRKSPWTQTPHLRSFPANPPHPPVFLSRSSWKDVLFLKGKLWHSHLNRLQWK